MGIFFALLYATTSAVAKIALKKGYDNLPSSTSFAVETVFGIVLWVSFGLIKGINIENIISIFPVILISAILSEAYIFYVYSKGKLSIVIPVFASYSIFTVLFSNLFIQERLSIAQLVFILLTISGILILSVNKDFKIRDNTDFTSILWALSGAVAVGISDTLSKGVINETSSGEFLTGLAIAQVFVCVGFMKLEKQNLTSFVSVFQNYRLHKFTLIAGLLLSLAMIFFWLAFEHTLASIASPLTATTIMFVVLFARILLKEKISKKNLLGIVIIIIGVMGINLIS